MYKYLLGFIFLFSLGGCMGVVEYTPQPAASQSSKNMVNLYQVKEGMKRQEVMALLKNKVIIGYTQEESGAAGPYTTIFLENPYRSEVVKVGPREIYVDYFYTNVVSADGIVSDDELVPLIYENERLIGKDNDFLYKLKQNL